MKSTFSRIATLVTTIMLVLSTHTNAQAASSPAPAADSIVRCELLVYNSPTTSNLIVDLYIENVTDLYGADMRLSFNPAAIQVVDANASTPGVQILPLGGFLSPGFVVRKVADNSAGTIWYAATQLNPSPPVSGTGAVARITFQPVTTGTFTLTFTYQKLATINGDQIPAITQNCTLIFGANPTTMNITSDNPDPSLVGQAVVVNYTVTSVSGTPSGDVTLSDGIDTCTGTVAAGKCTITFTTTGAKTITATYNPSTPDFFTSSDTENHTVEGNGPWVVSSLRVDPNPTAADFIRFLVTFSEPVTGVDAFDFTLTVGGITEASVTSVSGGPTAYTVNVNTGNDSGTLRLDVLDNDTIINDSGIPLGGESAGNGNYIGGETYDGRTMTFIDVPNTYWAWSWIERLYYAGITSGCSADPLNYCPESNVTRAEMAVFLLRSKYGNNYTPPAATGIFSDVPTTYWAINWIEKLYADGITSGCGTSPLVYCPEDSATRAQMAIFLLRAEHGSAYTPLAANGTIFSDVPAGYWAAAWVEQMAAEGITTGCSNGNYFPEVPVTRAQMADFLVRGFNLP